MYTLNVARFTARDRIYIPEYFQVNLSSYNARRESLRSLINDFNSEIDDALSAAAPAINISMLYSRLNGVKRNLLTLEIESQEFRNMALGGHAYPYGYPNNPITLGDPKGEIALVIGGVVVCIAIVDCIICSFTSIAGDTCHSPSRWTWRGPCPYRCSQTTHGNYIWRACGLGGGR